MWNFITGLDFTQDTDRLPNKNTIITVSSPTVHNERVIEVTPAGEMCWIIILAMIPIRMIVIAFLGYILISFRNWNTMIEINPQGDIVWQYNGTGTIIRQHNPNRLYNRHTVMTDSNNDQMIEIDKDGDNVWEYNGTELCSFAPLAPVSVSTLSKNMIKGCFSQSRSKSSSNPTSFNSII